MYNYWFNLLSSIVIECVFVWFMVNILKPSNRLNIKRKVIESPKKRRVTTVIVLILNIVLFTLLLVGRVIPLLNDYKYVKDENYQYVFGKVDQISFSRYSSHIYINGHDYSWNRHTKIEEGDYIKLFYLPNSSLVVGYKNYNSDIGYTVNDNN